MAIDISVRADVKAFQRSLDEFARKQMPFATAQALNAVALRVRDAERENMVKRLDRPTPFTVNSVAVQRATKAKLQATVFVKDIAARYLEPYELGGVNKLDGRALIKPVAQRLNQYGNLPRTTVRRLAARKNVFVGKVKTKAGTVDGVWQRTKAVRGKRAGLQLLVKFEDAHKTQAVLGYRAVAAKTVAASFGRELNAAFARALASARR
ncbi:hypothetical protein [Cupriavidus pauculus]|uniref:hypothetical protein n=1 Tax=Cupriavidus pauculus TaxID=82633 RepID=UPI001D0C53D4|nr:hypothetical protein [Cupriavidus pauculus]